MRLIFAILFCFLLSSGAFPQSSVEQKPSTNSTYILLDASGTMEDWRGDALSILSAKQKLLGSDAQVSVSFFGQRPESPDEIVDCEDPVLISDLGPISDELFSFPELGRDQDTTAIGQALLAALNAAGEHGHVVLITDGNDECASNFQSIRTNYPSAKIEIYQVGDDPNTALELLELSNFSIVTSNSLEFPNPVVIDFKDQKSEWETAELLARWNWLIGISILLLAIVVFGIQYGFKAHTLERHLKKLRDEKRKSQDGKLDVGTSEEHYKETMSELRKSGNYWVPLVIFSVGVLYILFVTFGPDSHFAESRKMAWMVLSSSFAIVLSVFTSTPLFFASSQYWRSVQARQTYENEVDLAKIVELQQQRAKLAREYRDYKQLRRLLGDQTFASPWPTGSWSSLSPVDRAARRTVEKRARQLAIADEKSEADPKVVSDETARLKRYRVEPHNNPRVDAWITLLVEDGFLRSDSWDLLRERIEAGHLDDLKIQFGIVSTEVQQVIDEQFED